MGYKMWSRGGGVGQEKVDRRPLTASLPRSFKFKFKVGAACGGGGVGGGGGGGEAGGGKGGGGGGYRDFVLQLQWRAAAAATRRWRRCRFSSG